MAPGFRIQTIDDEERSVALKVMDTGTDAVTSCDVSWRRTGDLRSIDARMSDGRALVASSELDFEEAFQALRDQFEARRLLLLCNRYRIDAFVSSMSRQMSDGLLCYTVEARVPVDPSRLVECLAPAPLDKVVTREENDAFITAWIAGFDDEDDD
jgi:hypothetical protein